MNKQALGLAFKNFVRDKLFDVSLAGQASVLNVFKKPLDAN